MTDATKQPCPFCGRPREADGGIIHPANCEGLQDSGMNKLQERFLRDELSTLSSKLVERDQANLELRRNVGIHIATIKTLEDRLDAAEKELAACHRTREASRVTWKGMLDEAERRLSAYQLRRKRAQELVRERGSEITIPELLSHIFADYDSDQSFLVENRPITIHCPVCSTANPNNHKAGCTFKPPVVETSLPK